jgi:predicted negative regulator of RcsB-dependent stress response
LIFDEQVYKISVFFALILKIFLVGVVLGLGVWLGWGRTRSGSGRQDVRIVEAREEERVLLNFE